MINILMIGGDERQLYAANALEQQGCAVEIYGNDRDDKVRALQVEDLFLSLSEKKDKTVVLPLPASRDQSTIHMPYFDKELSFLRLSEALSAERHELMGGMLPETWTFILGQKGIRTVDYFKDECLIIKNSVPTAEGVLGVLIANLPITLKNSSCVVFGFGRCGRAIAHSLLANGARVSVAARSSKALKEAEALGCTPVPIELFLQSAHTYDALINTIPHPVVNVQILSALRKDCPIVEIASAPYGVDFQSARSLGLRVLKEGSLPGRTSPKSAGQYIADTIISHIIGSDTDAKN